jgi:hypothetical protein
MNPGEEAAARLATALRHAQWWGNDVSFESDKDGDIIGSQTLKSCDRSFENYSSDIQRQCDDGEIRNNKYDRIVGGTIDEDPEVENLDDKESEESAREMGDTNDNAGGGVTSVDTNDAVGGTRQMTAETQSGEDDFQLPAQFQSEERGSFRSNLVLPEALRRRLEESDTIIPKIGPAQFIAPWKDQDGNKNNRKSVFKQQNSKEDGSARVKKLPGLSDESIFSASADSKANGSSIKSTATPASVDDDDTCSEFSLRTSTTLSSGFSKILPR